MPYNNTCLLIIDVQNALFNHESPLYDSEQILSRIQKLINFAINNNIPMRFIQHTETNGLFMPHTYSWAFHDAIKPYTAGKTIEKQSWDAFHKTSLHEELQAMDIERLIIAGMQTEFCLDTTIRRAYSLGYKNTVIENAHSTFSTPLLSADQIIGHHNSIWNGRFATLLPVDEIL